MNTKEGWMGRAAQLPVNLLTSVQLDGRSASVHVLYFEVNTVVSLLVLHFEASHPHTII